MTNRSKSLLRLRPPFVAGLLALFPSVGDAASGTIQDVQHVVILMQENRSFDHYFGGLRGVHGFNDQSTLLFRNGNNAFFQPQGTNYVLPFHAPTLRLDDVRHDWDGEHAFWNLGLWDQWVTVSSPAAMAYYGRDDLPYYYGLAEAYTVCDANYCSVMGPTFPNRLFLFTGMIDPNGTGGGPCVNNVVPTNGFSWTTYPERLQTAGVTWKVYRQPGDWFGDALAWFARFQSATPGNPLYDRGMATVSNVVSAFQEDVNNGTLPQVSWIMPPWKDSEHPGESAASGEIFVQQLLNGLASNPSVYNCTVFILTYDENGGLFDHLPPPVPPPGTTDEFAYGQPIGLGVRVPMLLVSPWTRGGRVCSQVFDHTSILRFLETWTGVEEPNISAWRRQVCGDLTSAFDFATPDTSHPNLPNASAAGAGTATPSPPHTPDRTGAGSRHKNLHAAGVSTHRQRHDRWRRATIPHHHDQCRSRLRPLLGLRQCLPHRRPVAIRRSRKSFSDRFVCHPVECRWPIRFHLLWSEWIPTPLCRKRPPRLPAS